MSSAVSEFKPISEPEPRWPIDREENRNILLRAFIKDGFCIAAFAHDVLALPAALEPQLRGLVGRKISVLCFENRYRVHDLSGEEHA